MNDNGSNIQQTSIDSYMEGIRDGTLPTLNHKIVDLILREGRMSNRMIAHALRADTATISGRVWVLIDSGVLEDVGMFTCQAPVNRKPKRVRFVDVVWPQNREPGQMSLL